MTVRIRKERFVPFAVIFVVVFIGLVSIVIHSCSGEVGGPEAFGYNEEQLDKLDDMDVIDEVSENKYYTPGLAAALDKDKFTTKYIKYFKGMERAMTDKDIVTAARLKDKGYSAKTIKKLFSELEDYEITPLIVFDYQSDVDGYIEDCKDHPNNSQEHFELDGDYVTYFDGARETDTSKGKLMLANKTNELGSDFLPGNRVEIPDEYLNNGAYNTTLNKEAADSLVEWAKESEEEGAPFVMQNLQDTGQRI